MRTSYRALIVGIVFLLVALAGVGGWLLRGGDDEASAAGSQIKVGVPTIVSVARLKQFAGAHAPVYWAGERPDTKLELTLTAKNAIFIRYLPKDAKAGTAKQYLTVATYSAIDGYAGLTAADKHHVDRAYGKNGAVIVTFDDHPLSTYFSFLNAGFQVEVFSPEERQARDMTDAGTIQLVGSNA